MSTLEEMRERVEKYRCCFLVQTAVQKEDSFDIKTTMETAANHEKDFNALWKALKKKLPGLMVMGTGGCSRCAKCTYPVFGKMDEQQMAHKNASSLMA